MTDPDLSYILDNLNPEGHLKLTYRGKTYIGERATIAGVPLGNYGHSFTASLRLTFANGAGQNTPTYHYTEADPLNEGETIGSGFGIEQLRAFLRVAGVDAWNEPVGREIFPLYYDNPWAPMVGLFNPANNEILIFSDQLDAWKDRINK